MPKPTSKRLTLLLGGARSGKSSTAQRLAEAPGAGRVLFVATAEAGDEDMSARIERHRAERPAGWATLEAPRDLASAIGDYTGAYDTLVLDCLTLWVSNLMLASPDPESDVLAATESLLRTYDAGTASWVVVSNEVGLGVVPATALGRSYRDLLGRVNQLVAARADGAYLLVAGRALALERL